MRLIKTPTVFVADTMQTLWQPMRSYMLCLCSCRCCGLWDWCPHWRPCFCGRWSRWSSFCLVGQPWPVAPGKWLAGVMGNCILRFVL